MDYHCEYYCDDSDDSDDSDDVEDDDYDDELGILV